MVVLIELGDCLLGRHGMNEQPRAGRALVQVVAVFFRYFGMSDLIADWAVHVCLRESVRLGSGLFERNAGNGSVSRCVILSYREV